MVGCSKRECISVNESSFRVVRSVDRSRSRLHRRCRRYALLYELRAIEKDTLRMENMSTPLSALDMENGENSVSVSVCVRVCGWNVDGVTV